MWLNISRFIFPTKNQEDYHKIVFFSSYVISSIENFEKKRFEKFIFVLL